MAARNPQAEAALLMLTGDSPILSVARELSEILVRESFDGAIIGGVAVFLHGYRRTTTDVDAYCDDREAVAKCLLAAGFVFHADKQEFVRDGIPVHLLTPEELGHRPVYLEEREAIRTVSLGELLTLKLKTGVRNLHRAKDLADVVELIKARDLNAGYSPRIADDVRAEYRRIIRDLKEQG